MGKLSESNKKTIKKYFTKKYSIKEGIIDYIFGKMVVNKLKNDKEFVSMAKDLDTDLQSIKDLLAWHAKKDTPLPPDMLNSLPNLKIIKKK